jgi:signal transduction histidine kinase
MPFIFDPFYRGSNSRREEGKGLGLAVVKNIVDSYGWNIAVESKTGGGSTFVITIACA